MLKSLKDTIKFGKYKGRTVASVLEDDASYLLWLIRNTGKTSFDRTIIDVIETEAESQESDFDNDDYFDHEIWEMED